MKNKFKNYPAEPVERLLDPKTYSKVINELDKQIENNNSIDNLTEDQRMVLSCWFSKKIDEKEFRLDDYIYGCNLSELSNYLTPLQQKLQDYKSSKHLDYTTCWVDNSSIYLCSFNKQDDTILIKKYIDNYHQEKNVWEKRYDKSSKIEKLEKQIAKLKREKNK